MVLYTIKLSQLEVDDLKRIINKGSHTSANPKITNEEICKVLKVGARTINRVKKKFVEEGFEGALERRPSTQTYKKKADGDLEAKLVTLCCSEPPEGFARWSLRLLADKLVELEYVDYISHVTVREVLKKTNLNLGK